MHEQDAYQLGLYNTRKAVESMCSTILIYPPDISKQEAQLSHRDCTTVRVIVGCV